jgi:hypothetical protein
MKATLTTVFHLAENVAHVKASDTMAVTPTVMIEK